ncbi:immunoglobulin domain-containing protein [Nibricoccus sp. IMCC34717]|uniref:immunoglobulin domain-containing protein n=1 Tax=Nibricoccus sp. IMCC34717 TaxID=3034021 RepID=UPI003850DCC9
MKTINLNALRLALCSALYAVSGSTAFGQLSAVNGVSTHAYVGPEPVFVNVRWDPVWSLIPVDPVYVNYGGTVELTLQNVPETKDWRHITPSGVVVVAESDRIHISDSTLKIENFSIQDEGEYFAGGSGRVNLVAGTHRSITALSSRFTISSASRKQIAGFVAKAGKDGTFVIRAVGNTLKRFGVSNPLRDPIFSVYDSNGTVVTPLLLSEFITTKHYTEAASMFPLDEGSDEPTQVYILRTGAYTVVIESKNQQEGEVLCEIYQLVK